MSKPAFSFSTSRIVTVPFSVSRNDSGAIEIPASVRVTCEVFSFSLPLASILMIEKTLTLIETSSASAMPGFASP